MALWLWQKSVANPEIICAGVGAGVWQCVCVCVHALFVTHCGRVCIFSPSYSLVFADFSLTLLYIYMFWFSVSILFWVKLRILCPISLLREREASPLTISTEAAIALIKAREKVMTSQVFPTQIKQNIGSGHFSTSALIKIVFRNVFLITVDLPSRAFECPCLHVDKFPCFRHWNSLASLTVTVSFRLAQVKSQLLTISSSKSLRGVYRCGKTCVMKVNYKITVPWSAFSFFFIRNIPLFETCKESQINFEQDSRSGLDAAGQ